jgi:hypothetical protein
MKKPFQHLIVLAVVAIAAQGCGGHTNVQSVLGPSNTTPTVPTSYPYPPGGGTPDGSQDPTWANATQVNFTLNGTNSGNETFTSQPFQTDDLLKIKVNALPAGVNQGVGNTNFTANYFCLGLTVTALGTSLDTNPLAVNGGSQGCQGASSQVFDLSRRLTVGHGAVSITISRPKYDWYCMLFNYYPWMMGGTAAMYCPLHPVYQYHTINGSIQVITNQTSGL